MKNFQILAYAFAALIIMMGKVNAKDLKILTVTNNDDGVTYDLFIDANEEMKAKGLKMYDRSEKDWTNFEISNLSNGAILKEEGSYKVILLKSNDFEPDRGGHFKVDYLYNGITGSRKEMPVSIDFDGHAWKVFHNGSEIKLLDFQVKKFLGKTIGIEKVLAK